MNSQNKFTKSSIGKKILMATTGLLLVGFLISHLAGNFLLFESIGGREAFNNYAHWLISHPLIIPMEIGLFALFIIHIFTALKVWCSSKAARPTQYAVHEDLGKATFASKTMLQTGSIIFIFLVLHLSTFKFGKEILVPTQSGYKMPEVSQKVSDKHYEEQLMAQQIKQSQKPVRDLYATVLQNFNKKWYSLVYIFCMIAMGIHLAHGIKSAFQTLGLNHPRYNILVQRVANVLAITFAVAYSLFPIYFGFVKPLGGQ